MKDIICPNCGCSNTKLVDKNGVYKCLVCFKIFIPFKGDGKIGGRTEGK